MKIHISVLPLGNDGTYFVHKIDTTQGWSDFVTSAKSLDQNLDQHIQFHLEKPQVAYDDPNILSWDPYQRRRVG